MHAVLEGEEGVPAALDGGGEEAGAAVERHKIGGLRRGFERPAAFDDTERVVGNEDGSAAGDEEDENGELGQDGELPEGHMA